MTRYYRWILAAAAAAMAAFLPGCGSGTSSTALAIRIINGVPSTSSMDFIISGSTFVGALPFDAITTYGYINQGTNDFEGVVAGTSTVIVPDQKITLSDGVYTVIAAGDPLNSTNPPQFYAFMDINGVPNFQTIRVRAINASPDAGPIDVILQPSNSSTAPQTVATGVSYPTTPDQPLTLPYASLPPATYDIVIRKSGASTNLVVKTAQQFTGGHVFTIIVTGRTSDNTEGVIAQEDV